MPHVTFVPLVGFRIREAEMLAFGMTLPGLQARGEAIGQLPALGLLTLAGMLPENWTCSYLPVQRVDDAAIEGILAERPDLVAISSLTASILDAYRLSDRLRAAGLRTVIGGLHATALPDEAAAHCDAVVVGPGENVWHALLADVAANDLKRVYDARKTRTASRWSMPRFDLIDGAPARYTLQTARGCPLACDFCAASRMLGPFVEKPVDRVAAELDAINQLTRRPLVELADDNTFAGARDPAPLFDVLGSSGARYFTEADWRIGERPEILEGLAHSGCVQVLMGIESLVFRYPGMGQKHAELERILAAVERIQAAGVAVNGCFILGADGEDRASIERLVAFLLESPFAEIQLTLQTPFPGTQLYQRLAREGRMLLDRDWSNYTLFDVTYQPDRLSVQELEVGFREALAAVFNQSATARREQIRKRIWKAGKQCRKAKQLRNQP